MSLHDACDGSLEFTDGHEALIEAAKKAIDEVFSDTSVSQEETISSLKDLIDHCRINIDAIEADLEREERG